MLWVCCLDSEVFSLDSMSPSPRSPCLHHCTSEPLQFFGRREELSLLDRALDSEAVSLIAMIGPGGQGKTAIVQTWLQRLQQSRRTLAGIFLWSFYRGKDADLCLRELYQYAERLPQLPTVSASYCVDHLLTVLRQERWAIVLDGTEVVQHDSGSWYGRLLHPELGRLLEEVAAAAMPGLVLVTTRFPLPTLTRRSHARLISLASLDPPSAVALLRSLGVHGPDSELSAAAALCGEHAKAVELLGTYLVRFQQGLAQRWQALPALAPAAGASDEEERVARVLAAFRRDLAQETQDILALATAFRQPPTEERLLQYLASPSVRQVLHQTWQRGYPPFQERPADWLAAQVQELVDLRLLERVRSGSSEAGGLVMDAHPLVRRGFEDVLGSGGRQHSARARAGFLRGRPDRRPPNSLAEAREEVELFHAYCDASLWSEADSVYVAFDNPKHRFLAPAFERDLLLRFFPQGDARQPPLWSGFGRYRSLAICFELLGQFEQALQTYPPADAALRGDALLALGRLSPLLEQPHMAEPWQALWQAYRCHALCLAGRTAEALALARSLVPIDVYEWVHVFECLLRAGQLTLLDMRSLLYRPPLAAEQRWSQLARQRMRLDLQRLTTPASKDIMEAEYRQLVEDYERGGLPWERSLGQLSYARWLAAQGDAPQAERAAHGALELAQRQAMPILAADAWEVLADIAADPVQKTHAQRAAQEWRQRVGYVGPGRP